MLGAASPPSNLSTIVNKPLVSLTWLAPPNGPTDCVFNFTINITNYSSSSSCYSTSNTESLILTDDLITRGHNYSFAVAVTDSTGQHGPWSDQLTVTYDGIWIYLSTSFHKIFVTTVPGRVSFIVLQKLTNINVIWQVRCDIKVMLFYIMIHCIVSASSTDSWFPSPSVCSVLQYQ